MSDPLTHEFDPPITGGVVVGHDGSSYGDAALAWAHADAARRGCDLHVIRAWVLSSAAREVKAPFGSVPSYAECEAAVTKTLEDVVARVIPADSGVPVHRHVVHLPSAPVLLAASATADLVVVARRGHGGFTGLVLGSTAEQVLRHAKCPVVVVRSPSSAKG